nr:hypothetical protein [Tanacetum cinerariifolium]
MLEKVNYIPWESRFRSKRRRIVRIRYEWLTILVNIMDRNNVRLISVSMNTKFLNCLQPEWSKYVTMVRHNQTRETVSYDMLYDSLVQVELHVLASKAKKAAKNHDPFVLIAHSNASSSQYYANSSYLPQPYYVTHPLSVVDYEDEYQGELQGDSQEDKLTTAMIEQLLLALKDKSESNLNNEENDFMLDTSYVPSDDAKAVAVQSSQQWHLFFSGSGNFLHWQWELLLTVGTS